MTFWIDFKQVIVMRVRNLTLLLSMVVYGLLGHTSSFGQEYEPWTGAVAGSNIHLGSNENLKSVGRLINRGRTEGAVRAASRYLDSLTSNQRSGRTSTYVYDAYNALCIALTADKQFDKAMEACDQAIEMSPARWQAINSRGSLNYKTGKYEAALNDYREALEKAPNLTRVRKIIEHNVEISQARVMGN